MKDRIARERERNGCAKSTRNVINISILQITYI